MIVPDFCLKETIHSEVAFWLPSGQYFYSCIHFTTKLLYFSTKQKALLVRVSNSAFSSRRNFLRFCGFRRLFARFSVSNRPLITPRKWHLPFRATCTGRDTYSLRHRKCGVRGFIHELFVSKTRTSEVRASEGFWHKQLVNKTPYIVLSMSWAVYYTKQENFHWTSFLNAN